MHNASDSTYYNVESIMIYDPSVSYDAVTNDIPSVPFVDYWSGLFNFNQTFMDHLHEKWGSCGYADFYDEAFTFPPKGPLPTPPNVDGNNTECSLWVSWLTQSMTSSSSTRSRWHCGICMRNRESNICS